jgi:hypothetical protein
MIFTFRPVVVRPEPNWKAMIEALSKWRTDTHHAYEYKDDCPPDYIFSSTDMELISETIPNSIYTENDVLHLLNKKSWWMDLWGNSLAKFIADFESMKATSSSPSTLRRQSRRDQKSSSKK